MKNKISMSKTRLSKKTKKNLKRNAREKGNKFVKMQPSENRLLEFNPEQIGLVETECYNIDTGKSEKILIDLEDIRRRERMLNRMAKLGMAMGW